MIENKAKIYEFDGFRLEADERRFLKNGVEITLPSKAFDLLYALVEKSGHLVTKEDLYQRVWADSIVEDANLTVQMSAIRKALGSGDYIKTVKGHGYRFTADVRMLNGETADYILESKTFSRVTVEHESETETATLAAAKPKKADARKLLLAFAGIALAAALGIGGYAWRSGAFAEKKSTVAAFQSGSIKRLTSTGRIGFAAAISPDGRLFAYSQVDGEQQSLWVGHVGGGEPMQVRAPAEAVYQSAHFSPDGARLYYTVSDGLYRMPVFGGVPEKISDKVSRVITFSPDGERFAFVRSGKPGEAAVVISLADGREENVIGIPPTSIGFAVNSLAWSPDGSAIAVGASVNENGTSYEVFTIDVNDGSLKQVTSGNFSGIDSLSWLGDGSGLIAVSAGTLWHVAFPNGESQRLLNDLSMYGLAMDLSDSGAEIVTVQTEQYSNIWIAPTDDLKQAKQVTFGSLGRAEGWSGIDWTGDGKIIYTTVVGNKQTIWTMNADGTGQAQLTPSEHRNFHPSVSDDGRTIVFASVRSGKYGVWRINSDGNDLRQLTNDEIAAQPHISPDGKWVVYIDNRESLGTLHRIPADGGEPVQLTENKMSWVRVSPDSKYVAGAYRDEGKISLAVIPIEGGKPVKTFDVPRLANFRLGVRWSPDGKFIAYRDWANGIWKQNIDSGEPERIAGLPEEKLYSFGWSRDGKQFAFARGREIRDVVLLTKAN